MQVQQSQRTRGDPKTRSIQIWLAWILCAFLALVVISVCLTFWELDAQRYDAQVIDLAGRQRLLIQQMASLSLKHSQAYPDYDAASLLDAANSFEQALAVLQNEGKPTAEPRPAMFMRPTVDRQVSAESGKLAGMWQEYQTLVHKLANSAPGSSQATVQSIQEITPVFLAQADRVVQAYEDVSAARILSLRYVQLGFLCGGLVLLIISGWVARRWVVQPLDQLNAFARQVGEGKLDEPITIQGPEEIWALSSSMETMRVQLQQSQGEIKQWIGQLEERVRQRTETLEALAAVSQEIASHLSLSDVFRSVTEKAQQLLGSDVALLCLLDDHQQNLTLHALAGPEKAILKTTTPVYEQAAGRVLNGNSATPCGTKNCPSFCQILDPAFRSSHIAAPLRSGKAVIGALCVGSAQAGKFRPESLQALSHLTSIAAVALENSRAYGQVERIAALEERQRMASDMHDGLLQTLSFLRWMANMSGEQLSKGDVGKASATFQQIERAVDQAEREIRRAIASLQENFSVHYTLQDLLAEMIDDDCTFRLPVQWENNVNSPVVLPRSSAEQILRVAREALLNAQDHSQADQVILRFEKAASELALSVIDNGIGFLPDAGPVNDPLSKERPHFGMKIMQARAARLNGRIEIDSSPGTGTRVTLRWPAPVRSAEHAGYS